MLEVVHGDCIDVSRSLDDNSLHSIITSPPYNIGVQYENYTDSLPDVEYCEWLNTLFSILKPKLNKQGHLFINMSGVSNRYALPMQVAILISKNYVLQNHIAWIKAYSSDDKSEGHFKPKNSSRFMNHTWEHIFHFTPEGTSKVDKLAIGVPFADKSNIQRRQHQSDLRDRGDVWFIPHSTRNAKLNHPATFEVEVVEMMIKFSGQIGPVFDPFCGSGSTLLAARNLGVSAGGCDISLEYVAMAKARLGIN